MTIAGIIILIVVFVLVSVVALAVASANDVRCPRCGEDMDDRTADSYQQGQLRRTGKRLYVCPRCGRRIIL